jgi:hypothetical protein
MKTIILLFALAVALMTAENPISLNAQQGTKLMELIKTDKDAKARFETLKRAESEDENYNASHLFNPIKGGHSLKLAGAFDKNLSEVYCQATDRTVSNYPSCQFVINAARNT